MHVLGKEIKREKWREKDVSRTVFKYISLKKNGVHPLYHHMTSWVHLEQNFSYKLKSVFWQEDDFTANKWTWFNMQVRTILLWTWVVSQALVDYTKVERISGGILNDIKSSFTSVTDSNKTMTLYFHTSLVLHLRFNTANSSLTESIGQKSCSSILVTQEPKSMSSSPLLVMLQTVYTLARSLMNSPASKLSSLDVPRAISVFVASLYWSRIMAISNFLSAMSLSHSYNFSFNSWL